VLYQERKTNPQETEKLDRSLVRHVLDQAKRVVAHPSKPRQKKIQSFKDNPTGDIEIEESLEESPVLSEPDDLKVETQVDIPISLVAILDSSSSMSGEKHLLASIAVAVLTLKLPAPSYSVVVFASDAKSIKKMKAIETPEKTILNFLKSQPRGFTNIQKGLEQGLKELKSSTAKKRIGLIATDGRTTEGKDPMDTAKQYDFLVVLHLHGPGSHLESSQLLASHGHGICLEVEKFEDLPKRLYDSLRLIARR